MSDLYRRFQKVWEWFNLGVLGLNSFIMLYYRGAQGAIQYVVCAGALGYALVLLSQSVLYRRCPEQRMQTLKLTRKIFRLIYTAVYLTSTMMNIIVASQMQNSIPLMVYYGWIFIWAAVWGTNCFWAQKVCRLFKVLIPLIKVKIIGIKL